MTPWKSSTVEVTNKKKMNLLYIIYIHFLNLFWKDLHNMFFFFFFLNLEVLLMNRMSDGHIPMATNQTWTGVFWQFWFNWQPSPGFPFQPPFLHYALPAERLPMLTVAATFLGYIANDPKKKKKWKSKQVGRGERQVLSLSTSVQRTQCLRQHA